MSIFLLLLSVYFLTFQASSSTSDVAVDGVTKWSHPIAYIGDTILFKHKDNYRVYIFRNKHAFKTCDFTQATHLSNPNSTSYTWHPSRAGNFYFSFYNGTNKPCILGQKLTIKVKTPLTQVNSPAPSPTSGSPVYPWPNRPREENGGSPAPTMAVMIPGEGGSIPFINSNPAIPLPTGEVDSSTVGVLPKSVTNHAHKNLKAVGLIEVALYISIYCTCMMVMI